MSFILSFAVTALLMPLLIAVAWRLGWVAKPRENRWHHRPTALMGGVPIALGVCLAWWVTGLDPVLVGATLGMLTVGVIDDRLYELFPVHKLLGQVVAAGVLAACGWIPAGLPHPFAGLVAVVWMVGITNAFNLLDNMDGLSSGVGGIVTLGLAALAYLGGMEQTALQLLALSGGCWAFLLFNFRPARVFMGDCGSMFLGLALGALSLRVTHGSFPNALLPVPLLPVLSLAVLLLDTGLVSWCRWRAGRPVLPGAPDHASHRLARLGWGEGRTALAHYLFALGWASTALLTVTQPWMVWAAPLALMALLTGAAATFLARIPIYPQQKNKSVAGRAAVDHSYEGARSR